MIPTAKEKTITGVWKVEISRDKKYTNKSNTVAHMELINGFFISISPTNLNNIELRNLLKIQACTHIFFILVYFKIITQLMEN